VPLSLNFQGYRHYRIVTLTIIIITDVLVHQHACESCPFVPAGSNSPLPRPLSTAQTNMVGPDGFCNENYVST